MQQQLIRSDLDELHLRSRRVSKDQSKILPYKSNKGKDLKMSSTEVDSDPSTTSQQQLLDTTSQTSLELHSEVEQLEEIPVIDMEYFRQVGHGDKLDLIMAAINKVNTTFYHKLEEVQRKLSDQDTGLIPRLQKVEEWMEDSKVKIDQITEQQGAIEELDARLEGIKGKIPTWSDMQKQMDKLSVQNATLQDDVALLKGVLQTHDKKLLQDHESIVDLKKRSMQNNIIIYGITGDSKEETSDQCKQKVLSFMSDKMKMVVHEAEIEVAHRLGKRVLISSKATKDRPIVVRCQQKLRDRVFEYTSNLKGLKNSKEEFYSVKPQLPEPLATQKKERDEKLRSIRKANKLLTEEEQDKKVEAEIKDKTLFINKVPQKQHITPPSLRQVFNLDAEQKKRISQLKLVHSQSIEEKGSIFRGHAVRIQSSSDIRLIYKQLRLLFPESDHIILGYKVKNFEGYHDDGEHAAGNKLLQILHDRKSSNTAVFVTRDFGGIHLGIRRFVHIEKAAREALNLLLESF